MNLKRRERNKQEIMVKRETRIYTISLFQLIIYLLAIISVCYQHLVASVSILLLSDFNYKYTMYVCNAPYEPVKLPNKH